MNSIEIIPAILRNTFEGIQEDWTKVQDTAEHIQIDVTDGVFAGDGTFRQVREFKKLPASEKIELHMMVHTPANFVDDIIDLSPARCIFHIEAFEGTNDLEFTYKKLRSETQTELGLAINPPSPNERLEEHLSLIDYVLFMGYSPGWAGQDIHPEVFMKIGQFHDKHPDIPISVDGHVDIETAEKYVRAGATMLCANSAIFKEGNPKENIEQLKLRAHQGTL